MVEEEAVGGIMASEKSHPDERMVKGKSGNWLTVHPSYKLAKEVWLDLPDAEVRRINDERAAYKKSKRSNDSSTVISQLTTDTSGMATIQVPIAMIQQATTNDDSAQSETNTNPMGGRNEQAQLQSLNGSRS